MAHRVAQRAEADLDDIWLYVAKESSSIEIANRLIDAITDRFFTLARFPYMGRSREEDFGPGYRSLPVGEYVARVFSLRAGASGYDFVGHQAGEAKFHERHQRPPIREPEADGVNRHSQKPQTAEGGGPRYACFEVVATGDEVGVIGAAVNAERFAAER